MKIHFVKKKKEFTKGERRRDMNDGQLCVLIDEQCTFISF